MCQSLCTYLRILDRIYGSHRHCTVTRDSLQVGVAVTLAGIGVVSGRIENRQGTLRSSRRFLQGSRCS